MLVFEIRHHKTDFYVRMHAIENRKKNMKNHEYPNTNHQWIISYKIRIRVVNRFLRLKHFKLLIVHFGRCVKFTAKKSVIYG